MIRVADIQRAVAAHRGVDIRIMREPDGPGARARSHSRPRQEAMTLALLLTEHSYTKVGQLFGGRDHTTVLEARKRVQQRISDDRETREAMRRLTLELVLRESQAPRFYVGENPSLESLWR